LSVHEKDYAVESYFDNHKHDYFETVEILLLKTKCSLRYTFLLDGSEPSQLGEPIDLIYLYGENIQG